MQSYQTLTAARDSLTVEDRTAKTADGAEVLTIIEVELVGGARAYIRSQLLRSTPLARNADAMRKMGIRRVIADHAPIVRSEADEAYEEVIKACNAAERAEYHDPARIIAAQQRADKAYADWAARYPEQAASRAEASRIDRERDEQRIGEEGRAISEWRD